MPAPQFEITDQRTPTAQSSVQLKTKATAQLNKLSH